MITGNQADDPPRIQTRTSQVQSGRRNEVKVDGRAKVDGPFKSGRSSAKLDSHLHHSGRSRTIVDVLLSQSGRSRPSSSVPFDRLFFCLSDRPLFDFGTVRL